MTDKELAQRAGVALTTVLHIKDTSFEYLPRLSTVIKIANALGIPYTDLIS
jgi:DNA-binding XRE family transcriptional regulator